MRGRRSRYESAGSASGATARSQPRLAELFPLGWHRTIYVLSICRLSSRRSRMRWGERPHADACHTVRKRRGAEGVPPCLCTFLCLAVPTAGPPAADAQVALRKGDLDLLLAKGRVDGEAEVAGDDGLQQRVRDPTRRTKSSDDSPKLVKRTAVDSRASSRRSSAATRSNVRRTRSVSQPIAHGLSRVGTGCIDGCTLPDGVLNSSTSFEPIAPR